MKYEVIMQSAVIQSTISLYLFLYQSNFNGSNPGAWTSFGRWKFVLGTSVTTANHLTSKVLTTLSLWDSRWWDEKPKILTCMRFFFFFFFFFFLRNVSNVTGPSFLTISVSMKMNSPQREDETVTVFLVFCRTSLLSRVIPFKSISIPGPVVQSVVSLTSSLRVISLTVLADSKYNNLIVFAEKKCTAKATHIFSATTKKN